MTTTMTGLEAGRSARERVVLNFALLSNVSKITGKERNKTLQASALYIPINLHAKFAGNSFTLYP